MRKLDHYGISILRTVASFSILMIVTLWLGKQVNTKLNYYNFALSITVGSFVANMGFDYNLYFFSMLAAFLSLVGVYYIIAFLSSASVGNISLNPKGSLTISSFSPDSNI